MIPAALAVVAEPTKDEPTVALVATAADVMNRARALPKIASDEDATAAKAIVIEGKRVVDALEKRRQEFSLPVDRLLKAFNSHYAATRDPLKAAIGKVSDDAAAWDFEKVKAERARIAKIEEDARIEREKADAAEREAERQRVEAARASEQTDGNGEDDGLADLRAMGAQALADEAKEKADTASVDAAIAKAAAPVPRTTRVEGGGSTTLQTEWVHEVVDLSKVPREYLALDEAKVKFAIKDGARGDSIQGLRIVERPKMATRRW